MDVDKAIDRLNHRTELLDSVIAQRREIDEAHSGDRMYPYLAPFYPESLRWMGRTAIIAVGALKDLVIAGPTAYRHTRNNQEDK